MSILNQTKVGNRKIMIGINLVDENYLHFET